VSLPNDKKDSSNGWEAVADEFMSYRSSSIGVATIRRWAEPIQTGQAVLDVGCGFGGHYTQILIDKGLVTHGIDASPTLLQQYLKRFPAALARCEAAESSSFFDRDYDGVLSVGLIFLLAPEDQILVLQRMASALKAGGKFIFTSPHQICDWDDLSTGRKSRSLGREAYVDILQRQGLSLIDEYTDEGENHYFDFQKYNSV